ncbi:MAG TPA: indolepyruvate ferredoxin oxidoreductase subunit alpha [Candidatus Deferrimicrobium sp.]|nr:indolepyruvate ferredoxin oxidoreductase subunit alpha [Candidatus Deferrimicrobium sp.]
MKKELLSGNEAIARGAYEAGVTFASAYPGTPSTEILENVAKYQEHIYCHWGANEKTAMEEALGACFTGARSLVSMKHVGLNVAADPFFSASYLGVKGGFIIISADDPGMHSSQNEQDNRNYALAAKMPVLEPSDSQEAKEMVIEGIKLGEKFNTPIMIRMTTRTCHSRSAVELGDRETPPEIEYIKDFKKTMLLPALARVKHVAVEKRQAEIKEFSNQFKLNYIIAGKSRVGVIASGISYQYGREIFKDAHFLKLGMPYPFPSKLLKEFAAQVDKIYVLEENDPFIENFVRLELSGKEIIGKNVFPLTGEMTPDVIRASLGQKDLTLKFDLDQIPKRPPTLCAGCPHTATFHNLSMQKINVTGDIGCYTLGALPPLNAMDTCIDMGASITALLGIEKACEKAGKKVNAAAVIGDSTFFHSGITGLLDIIYTKAKSTVIILDNSITAMTGHQVNPGTGLNLMGQPAPRIDIVKLVKEGLGIEHTYEIDGYDVKNLKEIIKREVKRDEPSVLVVRRPCVLLFRGAHWSPMQVDATKCTFCKLCTKLGCPAITVSNEKCHITPERCIGCSVCSQVCPVKAIQFVDENGMHIHDTTLEEFMKSKHGGKK